MSHKLKVGVPEKYVWFPIDRLSAEVNFKHNGEEYTAKLIVNNRYLKCRDYGHSVVFENLLVKANIFKDNKIITSVSLNIKHCFDVDVDVDEGDIFFDEERFAKEAAMMYEVITKN